jgi:hypothetical protein
MEKTLNQLNNSTRLERKVAKYKEQFSLKHSLNKLVANGKNETTALVLFASLAPQFAILGASAYAAFKSFKLIKGYISPEDYVENFWNKNDLKNYDKKSDDIETIDIVVGKELQFLKTLFQTTKLLLTNTNYQEGKVKINKNDPEDTIINLTGVKKLLTIPNDELEENALFLKEFATANMYDKIVKYDEKYIIEYVMKYIYGNKEKEINIFNSVLVEKNKKDVISLFFYKNINRNLADKISIKIRQKESEKKLQKLLDNKIIIINKESTPNYNPILLQKIEDIKYIYSNNIVYNNIPKQKELNKNIEEKLDILSKFEKHKDEIVSKKDYQKMADIITIHSETIQKAKELRNEKQSIFEELNIQKNGLEITIKELTNFDLNTKLDIPEQRNLYKINEDTNFHLQADLLSQKAIFENLPIIENILKEKKQFIEELTQDIEILNKIETMLIQFYDNNLKIFNHNLTLNSEKINDETIKDIIETNVNSLNLLEKINELNRQTFQKKQETINEKNLKNEDKTLKKSNPTKISNKTKI